MAASRHRQGGIRACAGFRIRFSASKRMMHLHLLCCQASALLLTVDSTEWQVAVNTTLTDVNAFLDHIVSSTNMRRDTRHCRVSHSLSDAVARMTPGA